MTQHTIGTRQDWLKARLQLLQAEKELTRQSDELAARRQQLPWVRVDKAYRFETDEGNVSLADLFKGRSQLLVYHFMFGPDYKAGCPSCSMIADGFNGFAIHLANHDVALTAVSRAPFAKLKAYKRRMGWSFPWASSLGSDFNFDFNVSLTEEQQRDACNWGYVSNRCDRFPQDSPVEAVRFYMSEEKLVCILEKNHVPTKFGVLESDDEVLQSQAQAFLESHRRIHPLNPGD